jgi:hypothetical protein
METLNMPIGLQKRQITQASFAFAEAHNASSRGSEGSFLLLHIAGRPTDS